MFMPKEYFVTEVFKKRKNDGVESGWISASS